MQIKQAEFITSSAQLSQCPVEDKIEYAFIGRSNVGKSSLINMLVDRKKLAKTSSTPGKTKLINHFLINNFWYLVDLPGYGYAKVSKTDRKQWGKLIYDYLQKREKLICVFVLLDSRHNPMKIDLEFMQWLGENGIPFVMVLTKTDKLLKSQLKKNVEAYKIKMLETWTELPPFFITSAIKSDGKEEILDFIEKTNETVKI